MQSILLILDMSIEARIQATKVESILKYKLKATEGCPCLPSQNPPVCIDIPQTPTLIVIPKSLGHLISFLNSSLAGRDHVEEVERTTMVIGNREDGE